MGRKLTLEEVLVKFKNKHGDKFDYHKFNYEGNRVKSTIICSLHGGFEQHSNSHLSGNGCPKCKNEISLNSFILKGSKTNNEKIKNNFIERCLEIHKNLDFSETNYVNKKTKVKVICKKHGEYFVTPRTLLNGHSCKKCSQENKIETWTLSGWSKTCKNNKSYFYLILFKNENEEFIKCGITNKSVISRKSKFSSKYYKEIILTIENTSDFCFNLEKNIKIIFKKNRFIPSINFSGKTECYDISKLEQIKKYINDKTK
jgi:hypothetical protein